ARLLPMQGSMGALALAFAILTAARSGEVRLATWHEIDIKEQLWTVAGERTKAGREHRVPLSDAAMDLFQPLAEGVSGGAGLPWGEGSGRAVVGHDAERGGARDGSR